MKIKLLFLSFVIVALSFADLIAQNGVRIAATTGVANASAMLDVESTSKGFLLPRVTLVALNNGTSPINAPAPGLLVYHLGSVGIPAVGVYYWDGSASAWVQLTAGGMSGSGTTNYVTKWTAANVLGNSQIFDNGTSVGIGTTTPSSTLDIGGTSNSTYIQNMAAWGLNARTQGLMIMPEGSVTDDGAGNITFGNTVIVMNTLSGSYIRVNAGTYALGSWGALWVAMPPTNARGTSVAPTVSAWADGDRNYDGRDRIILAQRNGGGLVYFNFQVPQTALNTTRSVVQMAYVQNRTRTVYATPISTSGNTMTVLNLTITPRKAGNAVILEWVINGEGNNDGVFNVQRNGVDLANATNGVNRWSGVAAVGYDSDLNSTMNCHVIKIVDANCLSTATTYTVLVRSSSATVGNFVLNGSWGNGGADGFEVGLSVGTATEIQQ